MMTTASRAMANLYTRKWKYTQAFSTTGDT